MATAAQSTQSAIDPSPKPRVLPLLQALSAQVSGASLGMFRIFFGLVMLLEAISITRPMASAHGSIPLHAYYTSPDITFHLPYPAFAWLPLFSPAIVKLIVWTLGLASVALAAGLFHRLAATLVFLTWGYLYVVESTRTYWMSYYYLELIFSFLIIFLPADRRLSLKSIFSKSSEPIQNAKQNTKQTTHPRSTPTPLPNTIPYWTVLLLRLQLVITYFYAGVAKLNADWLLDAQPVRRFLADASTGAPQFLQPLFASLPFAYFLSWSGAIFDLSVGFLLLARRTRLFGLLCLLLFHSTNHFLLFNDIVWFPLLGALSATIFLNPDWPDRFAQWLRKPSLPKPDLKWLVPGAILLPILGAALGWKSKPATRTAATTSIPRLVIPLLGAWLVLQTLIPLRHYFIPGDSRVTFEGLSFSWRLKAEFYGAEPAKLTIHDPNILTPSPSPGEPASIHWNRWPEDKTFFRFLKPGQVNYTNLPAIIVTFEPRIGERIFFNPVSASLTNSSAAPLTDDQSRAHVQSIWRERFGRDPKSISRTFALHQILAGYSRSLQARGFQIPNINTPDGLRDLMNGLFTDPNMSALVRRTHPFSIERGSTADHPFMLIEDPALFKTAFNNQPLIDRTQWKFGPEQSAPGESIQHLGTAPLPLHLLDDSPESIALLPRAAILTHPADPLTPRIHWNYYKDGTVSKAMHISTNPFLLRRYARRVAQLWQQQHGNYPKVTAQTALSLNTRPFQPVVDPVADLASVPVSRFSHNDWIQNLAQSRIQEAP
jgi:hypothetical protein